MYKFFNEYSFSKTINVACQSSDEDARVSIFEEDEYNEEVDYFIEYISTQKKNIESTLGEPVYFAFIITASDIFSFDPNEPETVEGVELVFNLDSFKDCLRALVKLKDDNIIFDYEARTDDDDYYYLGKERISLYYVKRQLCFLKHSDLMHYLDGGKKPVNSLIEKLIKFKYVENDFYQKDDEDKPRYIFDLSKKKDFDTLECNFKYEVDTSSFKKSCNIDSSIQELLESNKSSLFINDDVLGLDNK